MPLLFLLFLIETLSPIFSDIEFSKSLILESTLLEVFLLVFLNILTKFSACLTDNFFSINLFARNVALSSPTNIFACPAVIFFVLQNQELL